ncbi:hypothetical protein [Spirosoma gilvum]
MRKLSNKKVAPKLLAIIKNEHTKAQMSQLDDKWADYKAQDAYDLLDTLDCIARHNEPVRPFSEVKKEIITSRKA